MAGLATVLGSGAMTNSIEDVTTHANAFLIMGSNTTEAHPVIGAKIKKALRKGAQLVVVDPRKTELARLADVHLQIKPGSDVAILNALLNEIISEELLDLDFIATHTENFDAVKDAVADYTPEYAAAIAGVQVDDIRRAAKIYAKAQRAAIFYTMGITQHRNGTDNVRCIANLAMATGNLGKPGTGINPLRGQNNVQGACDMGALPNVFPGYQPVTSAGAKFQEHWEATLSDKPGLTVGEMFNGSLKAMYIIGENPVLSDPNSAHVVQTLKDLDFLVVQDIFLTETAELADVVLPAASFAEKDGTFVNTERRVQRVRKAIEPIGNSKADWEIIRDISALLDASWDYPSVSDIFAEIARVVPAYAGLSYAKLDGGGVQWPCTDADHPGTQILHKSGPVRGKGVFSVVSYRGAAEQPSSEYPFILTTGRILYHYHTGTMTRNAQGLKAHRDEELLEICSEDAQSLNLENGGRVRVSSRRGEVEAKIQITDRVQRGMVFMTFHFKESAANILTNSESDPTSKTPELKVAAVKIKKI